MDEVIGTLLNTKYWKIWIDPKNAAYSKNVGFLSIVIICVILLSSLLIMILKRYQVANQLPFALRKKTVQD